MTYHITGEPLTVLVIADPTATIRAVGGSDVAIIVGAVPNISQAGSLVTVRHEPQCDEGTGSAWLEPNRDGFSWTI
ncbi:MAG: hypothetical protein JSV84_06725 [Gemmatimonadota bacterium]|nr:MAG: hypothetical protein JSV84_06725 [Gemmatimonadota bacterium]